MSIIKKPRPFWGVGKPDGTIEYEPGDGEDREKWIKRHAGLVIGEQLFEENSDFSLPWLRYWRGVVCRAFMEIWEGYTNEETHRALKVMFFNLAEPGMPPKIPSFSRSGEAGETLIKARMPDVERYAAEQGMFLGKKGEFEDFYTATIIGYDLNKKPYTETK
jgi:hypothetical protein